MSARICLSGVRRHALYGWVESLGPERGWKATAGELAKAATDDLGFPVTRDHIVTARRALLPKPPTEPTAEARVDDHERRLLTLEAQVDVLAQSIRASVSIHAEPDPELTRPLRPMDPDVPNYGGTEDPNGA
jgi:hypothetical protein